MPTLYDGVIAHSSVRIVADLTEGHNPIFNSPYALNNGSPVAFTYGKGENGADAGYAAAGANYLTERFTNLTKKGKLPGDASGEVSGVAMTLRSPKKHTIQEGNAAVQITQAQACDPNPASWRDILDASGLVRSFLLRAFLEAYSPYIQYGDTGAKEYFASGQLLASGRDVWDGHSGIVSAPPYQFAVHRPWANEGDSANLRMGLELTNKLVTPAWADMAADATGSLMAKLRTEANFPAAGAAPAAGGYFVLAFDVDFWFYGAAQAKTVR